MNLSKEKILKLKDENPYAFSLVALLYKQEVFNWKKEGKGDDYLDRHVNKHPINDFFNKNIDIWNKYVDFTKDYSGIKNDYKKLSRDIINSKRFITFNTKDYNQSLNIYYTYIDNNTLKRTHFVTCLKKYYKNDKLYISSCFWRKKLLMSFEVKLSKYTKLEMLNPKDNSFSLKYANMKYDQDCFDEVNEFFVDLIDYFDEKIIKKYINSMLGFSKRETNITTYLLSKALFFEEYIDNISKRIKNENDKIYYVDYYDLFDDICYISLLYFENREKYEYYKQKLLNIDLNKQFEKTFTIFEYYYSKVGRFFESYQKIKNEFASKTEVNDKSFKLYCVKEHRIEKVSKRLNELKEKYENKRGKKYTYDDLSYAGDPKDPMSLCIIPKSTIGQYFRGNLIDRTINEKHILFLCCRIGVTKQEAIELMKAAGFNIDDYFIDFPDDDIFEYLDGNEIKEDDLKVISGILDDMFY